MLYAIHVDYMEKLNKLRSVESTSGANVENLSVEHVEETFGEQVLFQQTLAPFAFQSCLSV